ncbi:MAG: glycogen/starch/alpha-glucan phosphorylase [Bradymonadia bacterium]
MSSPKEPSSSIPVSETPAPVKIRVEDDRTGMSPETLERAVTDHLIYSCATTEAAATPEDLYQALARTVRDRLTHRWLHTQHTYNQEDVKRVYYLSAEFLLGRTLTHNLISLGIYDKAKELFARRGVDLAELIEREPDPGLGNGGLGRLAACFLDSMASLGLPGYGYGIRYDYGIFEQQIRDGEQVERADEWLANGCPWEVPKQQFATTVRFYGRVEHTTDEQGRFRAHWVDTRDVVGVPYDMPTAGHGNQTVNTLRLWSAKASKQFNLAVFNAGDFRRAVEEKAITEAISKVLYPSDQTPEGRELRLKQQYFFVCCSLHDILRRYRKQHDTFDALPEKVAIQLNDTHPSVAVAELMRVLVDEEGLEWEKAWDLTTRTIAYTNHTLMPEALERWPLSLFQRLLPRHLEIIFEINRRFLREVQIRFPGDNERLRRMSIIEEGAEKQVRMAHLAVVGAFSVNGVAELHSELVKSRLLPDFAQLWPHKFNNKTNGVTPRRWLQTANPELSQAITERIGDGWVRDLNQLEELRGLAHDTEFHSELRRIKQINKDRLTRIIAERTGIEVDPTSIFDVQIKRIHEYKRQLLNCLHIVALYLELRADPTRKDPPRTFIFGGKAAPGYFTAKEHIKLINDVAETINADPLIRDRIKVVFLPNYSVSLAERIIPATEVSEQISTAGYEASGTGNMKFTMNGALTVGTLDGANIEIRQQVGADNFFLFGLNAQEVHDQQSRGYRPMDFIAASPRLRGAIELIESGFFSPGDPRRHAGIAHGLRVADPFLVCADFEAYMQIQQKVSEVYLDADEWGRQVVHNLAGVGTFSSDRSIQQYADDIWSAKPVQVKVS